MPYRVLFQQQSGVSNSFNRLQVIKEKSKELDEAYTLSDAFVYSLPIGNINTGEKVVIKLSIVQFAEPMNADLMTLTLPRLWTSKDPVGAFSSFINGNKCSLPISLHQNLEHHCKYTPLIVSTVSDIFHLQRNLALKCLQCIFSLE